MLNLEVSGVAEPTTTKSVTTIGLERHPTNIGGGGMDCRRDPDLSSSANGAAGSIEQTLRWCGPHDARAIILRQAAQRYPAFRPRTFFRLLETQTLQPDQFIDVEIAH